MSVLESSRPEPRISDPTAQKLISSELHHLENEVEVTTPSTSSECILLWYIECLPPEILIAVLEFRKKSRDLDAATHVCKKWRATLISASCLWTEIDFENPERANCYLKRSKFAPIDVTVRDITEEKLGPTPWVERMESLCIKADPKTIKKFAEQLCQNAPNLQSLKIRGPAHLNSPIVLPPNLLGNVSSLRNLTFRNVSPSTLTTFSPPKLTHIKIKWDDYISRSGLASVRLEDLLNIFKFTPLVEVFEFKAPVQNPTGQPLRKFTLENLRKLVWTDTNRSNSLAPYITTPKLTLLKIVATTARSQPHQLPTPSSILPPDRFDVPLLSEPTKVYYSCDKDQKQHWSLNYPIDGHKVDIDYSSHENSGDWFSHLVHLISFSKVRDLRVSFYDDCADALDNFPIREFKNLGNLILVGKIQLFLTALGPNDGEPIPCTVLSQLHMHAFGDLESRCSALETLKDVLERRKKAGYMVKTLCISKPTKSGVADKYIKALENVVGELIPKWIL